MTQQKSKRAPRVGGHSPTGGRLRWSLERSGSELVLAARAGRDGVTIVLHVRSACALAANLFMATGEDSGDFAADFETAGSVELVQDDGGKKCVR